MALLDVKAYDPATAVTKSTAALLAMTALDTTNLRCTFVVPAGGRVMVRQSGVVHGATTLPAFLFGVLSGASVTGRAAPRMMHPGTLAATSLVAWEVVFPVSGLTAGATVTWDAAYGVETAVAASAIKYGGPNNATANDAFGAYTFEVYG